MEHGGDDGRGDVEQTQERWVAHIDMDAFFAAVEQLTRPTLRGRPVLVAGMGGRGVVAGASYESRVFGARSAMPTSQAVRLCRGKAVVVTPRFSVYKAASRRIFSVIRDYAGVIEQLSVDEGFAEPEQLRGATEEEARQWALDLQAAVDEYTGLPASVGMASTKLDAKMASDLGKPHGVAVVPAARRMEIFGPRPVSELWGIGRVAQGRLAEVGVHSIQEFVDMDPLDIRSLLSSVGAEIQRMAAGDDTRPVAPRARSKQVSAERTLETDVRTSAEVWRYLDSAARAAHSRLLKDGRAARTITAKVRTFDFQIHTRSATLPAATDELSTIISVARRVLPRPEDVGAIRLVGVGLSGLVDDRQEVLFPELSNPQSTGRIVVTEDSEVGELAPLNSRGAASASAATVKAAGDGADADTDGAAEETPDEAPSWEATQDIVHEEFGHGWVQGTGLGVVSVRFETRASGPGKTRTFAVTDPALSPGNPLDSLDWDLPEDEEDD